MLHVYISNVSSQTYVALKCFSCHKCFIFQRYIQRVMGVQPGRQGIQRGEPGACERGARARKWGARHPRGCERGARCAESCGRGSLGPTRTAHVDGGALWEGWGELLVSDRLLWTISYGWGATSGRATGVRRLDANAFVLIKRKRE
jgi:hypothetical protein